MSASDFHFVVAGAALPFSVVAVVGFFDGIIRVQTDKKNERIIILRNSAYEYQKITSAHCSICYGVLAQRASEGERCRL